MSPEADIETGQSNSGSPKLTILDNGRRRKASRRSTIAALLRCGVVLAIAIAIRMTDQDSRQLGGVAKQSNVTIEQVRPWFPTATAVKTPANGIASIVDSSDTVMGFALTTLPAAKDVVGYRGPGNMLLLLDTGSTVVGTTLLSSEDTPEHVAEIETNETFVRQFEGWVLGDPSTHKNVDSVSGATLTSLALAEGIAIRLGGEKPSLRFPDDFDSADLKITGTAEVSLPLESIYSFEAVIGIGEEQSSLIRTGPLADSIAGYQGPSEILLWLDSNNKIKHASLRRTFDNQPYASYLNDDTYFWKLFLNKTLRQVSTIDLEAEQVEGVSGATMTSLAVADTIIAAALEFESRKQQMTAKPAQRSIRWGWHDVGTLLILLGASIIALTRLRGIRWLRQVWNVILVVYLGLMTGNLISLAVVFGWAAQGVAWQLAPGLASVVVISFLLSILTRRNVYCSHICPHGAVQQLLKRPPKLSKTTRKRLSKLRWVPGLILFAAVSVTLLRINLNLAAWEPFNAYIWFIAGISSISLALGSLLFSWFVPMGYCRHACGTGRLLDYVRRSADSSRFTLADAVALTIAVAAWCRVVG